MKTLSTLIHIITLAAVAFPCGAPVVIEGRVTVGAMPMPGTVVTIYAAGEIIPIETVPVSPFGYYTLSPVLPCNGYRIEARHPKLPIVFPAVNIALTDLPQDGSNLIVNITGSF